MTQDDYQLKNDAVSTYENQKVPAVFRPLAEETLRKVPLLQDDHVLDVACGTGIVGRLIGERFGTSGRVVGIDLNAGMIEAARVLTNSLPSKYEWHKADVTNMPFEDDTFTIVFCQQGLQFFPDKGAALREIQRVLKPAGRLAITVWSGASDLFVALAEALERHVGKEIAIQSLAPFAFRDEEVIRALLGDAGFDAVTLRELTVERIIGPAKESIPREIAANPIGPAVAGRGKRALKQIVIEVEAALAPYQCDDGFAIPQRAHLFQATA